MNSEYKRYVAEEEVKYVETAIKSGVQSTEILNVLVITHSVLYVLEQLVNAMEFPNFTVHPITPQVIQKLYDKKKDEILEIKRTIVDLSIDPRPNGGLLK